MGAGVAKALGPHSVVMLKNHGIVTAAANVEEVVIRTIMFENAAQIQMIMEAAGDTAPEFPRERHREAQARHQPAGPVRGELRLPGAARQAPGALIAACGFP